MAPLQPQRAAVVATFGSGGSAVAPVAVAPAVALQSAQSPEQHPPPPANERWHTDRALLAPYCADLHTDRLSANFERSIAWKYRNVEFCPAEVLPGFAMHQTDRDPTALEKVAGGQRSNSHARARDFDLLGYRYSIMSSVGTAGLNNVVNMLPISLL